MDNFIVHKKTEDIYKDITGDVESRFGTSSYEVNWLLPVGKNKKAVGLMKDELEGQILKRFVGLRPKIYCYFKDNNDESKKTKGTKKCVVKGQLKFEDHKKPLKVSQVINIGTI